MPHHSDETFESKESSDSSKASKASKASRSKSPEQSVFPEPEKPFTGKDFDFLCENEKARYLKNSKKVGHAVIYKDKDGKEIAAQFGIPAGTSKDTPKVTTMEGVEAIDRYGLRRYRATSPGKTPYFATRYFDLELGRKDPLKMRIACFSPAKLNKFTKKPAEPFWGGAEKELVHFSDPSSEKAKRELPIFSDKLSKKARKELEKELAEIKPRKKGGEPLGVDGVSVKERDAIKTRKPDQNTVMEESAVEAYKGFYDQYTEKTKKLMGDAAKSDELSEGMKEILERAIKAPLRDGFYSNYRPEWNHLYGFGMTPMVGADHPRRKGKAHGPKWLKKSVEEDAPSAPQLKKNLVAAPKWLNTEQMILERIAKWFAINVPEANPEIVPEVEMLLDTQLAKRTKFELSLDDSQRFIKFLMDLDPFKKHHIFRKASDLGQVTAIADSLRKGIKPVSEQVIKSAVKEQTAPDSMLVSALGGSASASVGRSAAALSSNGAGSGPASGAGNSAASEGRKDAVSAASQDTASRPLVSLSSGSVLSKALSKEVAETAMSIDTMSIESMPTHLKHEKSIVQIQVSAQIEYYNIPWSGSTPTGWHGTGFVVEHDGKKYIVTNAHVVENSVHLKVRLSNSQKKFTAKRLVTCHQSDLALIEVSDPEFLKQAEPVSLGEMVKIQDDVLTIGFPIGGTEVSVTKGIVSRIQVGECWNDLDMLQAQVDSAINGGNSGGPVFSGGKVVGVAFQAQHDDGADGLGYMITMPTVKHFLEDALKSVLTGQPYQGFPDLPIFVQTLDNPLLRQYYNMTDDMTGVRVSKIDDLTDAKKKLKPDDILLEIDGLKISNEGKVDIPGIGNCIDFDYVHQAKRIGESVRFKVLRVNELTQKPEIQEIDVVLDQIIQQSKMIMLPEFDKSPTYYFASGICFQPLTDNYLETGEGGDMDFAFPGIGSLTEMPKKRSKDEQMVFINRMLDCDETHGYDYENEIVKEINGREIINIKDVVKAMDNNPEPYHVIVLSSNEKIVIKKMSKSEHDALLKRYHVGKDRSDDLIAVNEEPKRDTLLSQTGHKRSSPSLTLAFDSHKKRKIEEEAASASASLGMSLSMDEDDDEPKVRKKQKRRIAESDSDDEDSDRQKKKHKH